MSTGPVFRTALWFQVAAALYLALAPVNFVICCDPDGSIGLEPATADQRCLQCPEPDAGRREPPGSPSFSSGHRDCPCVDIPLAPGGDLSRIAEKPAGNDAPLLLVAAAPPPFLLPRLEFEHRDVAITASPPSPAVPHLRSVVLVV